MISASLFSRHLMALLAWKRKHEGCLFPGKVTADNCCEFNDFLNPREWCSILIENHKEAYCIVCHEYDC